MPPLHPVVHLLEVATGGGVDLFAYDRTPEEALEQARRARGLSTGPSGGGGGGDGGGKARDDGLSKSGTLEQVMARLQLQSYTNQVRFERGRAQSPRYAAKALHAIN